MSSNVVNIPALVALSDQKRSDRVGYLSTSLERAGGLSVALHASESEIDSQPPPNRKRLCNAHSDV